jgi:3-dehydroquinate dehydratase
VIAPVVNGTIAGFGGLGYDVAAHTAVALLG